MESIKHWLLSVCAIVILTTIIIIVIPNGRTSGIIKGFFSLITILVIISPIKNLLDNNFSFENLFNDSQIEIQEDFVNFIAEKKLNSYKENCNKILIEKGVSGGEITIIYEIDSNYNFSVKNVKINLKNAVINGQGQHIDIIKDIKKTLSDYLLISKGVIEIYE